MKLTKRFYSILLLTGSLTAWGCQKQANTSATNADSTSQAHSPDHEEPVLLPTPPSPDSITLVTLTREILKIAAAKDFAKLFDFIHPDEGIRFSPYPWIDVEEHKLLRPFEFQAMLEKPKEKVKWGSYDPMDEDIKLTLDGYFKEFGYDHDYLNEGRYAFDQTIGQSTIVNNLPAIYKDAVFVEAYWAPKDEEKIPFEWGSIRLVFKAKGEKYYLVGWVHDAWST